MLIGFLGVSKNGILFGFEKNDTNYAVSSMTTFLLS